MSDLKLRRYSNQAPETTLDGAISAADQSLTITGGSGWPSVPFTVRIESEVVLVTAVSGNDWTIEREYDDSIPASVHPDGSTIKHVLVADDFDHRWQDVLVTRPYGDTDDEFDDGDHSGLAKVTLGSTAWTESNGILSCLFSGQSTDETAAALESLSTIGIGSGVQTAVRLMTREDTANAGPIFSSGGTTTDSVIWQHASLVPGSSELNLVLRSGTYADTSTSHFSVTMDPMIGGWIHMRLVWVSVNTFRAWWSPDGISWSDFGQGSFAIAGVNPPTRMGVGVSARGGSGDKIASFEYLRVWSP